MKNKLTWIILAIAAWVIIGNSYFVIRFRTTEVLLFTAVAAVGTYTYFRKVNKS